MPLENILVTVQEPGKLVLLFFELTRSFAGGVLGQVKLSRALASSFNLSRVTFHSSGYKNKRCLFRNQHTRVRLTK